MLSSSEIKLPHLRLPAEIHSFFDKLILDLYRLSKSSTAKELKEKDSSLLEPRTIGRALSYLTYLGLVKRAGGKGIYELTDNGRKLGIELFQNNHENADKIWKDILSNHPIYELIKKYIEEKGGGIRGSSIGLAEYLRDKGGFDWKTSFLKAGSHRLCTLYSAKGLLSFDKEEDSISLLEEGTRVDTPAPDVLEEPQKSDNKKEKPQLYPPKPLDETAPPAMFNIDIKLNIEISKDTSPEIAQKTFDFLLKLSERGIQIRTGREGET